MTEVKNPKQIFKDNNLDTYWDKKTGRFEPKEYNSSQILFWHVPELLEENSMNLPAFMLIPGRVPPNSAENEDHRHDFYQARARVCKEYFDQEVVPRILNLPQGTNWSQDAGKAQIGILSEKIVKLLHNSSRRRTGAHLVGLYLDVNKLNKVFDCDFKEAERIVDNNLVLANLATIYSGFVENSDKFSTIEDREIAKKYYIQTKNLIASNPKIHLTPACCVVDIEERNGQDVISGRIYGDLWFKKLKQNQSRCSLQEDMGLQFIEYDKSQRVAIDPLTMFGEQKSLVEQTSKSKTRNNEELHA